MPFDVFTMAAVRDELDGAISAARVDKIIQPSALAVALKLWRRGQDGGSGGWAGYLVLSAAGGQARLYLTDGKLAKGFETPSSFLMLLRKYCTGGRVLAVRQLHLERVLRVEIATYDHGQISVIAEILGNRSNLILVGPDGMILGAVKLIGPRQSRIRRILPHTVYVPPPTQGRGQGLGEGTKLDPLSMTGADAISLALADAPQSMSIKQVLVGVLQGCSPVVAGDIAKLAGLDGSDALRTARAADLVKAIQRQYALLQTRQWSPIVIRREGRDIDYKAYAIPASEGGHPAAGMSAAIELVTRGAESVDALQAGRARLRTGLLRRRAEIDSRLASLRRGLAASAEADGLREAGNLILGLQYQLAPGQSLLSIPEMEKNIVLEPDLNPVANADRYFKRYRKARDAGKRVPPLVEKAQRDLEFVDELDLYVDLAETPADLSRIDSELAARFASKLPAKARPVNVGKVLAVDLGHGAQALVGRSARQNEEITFRLAGRSDVWLHARGVPGAHVVIRGLASSGVAPLDGPDGVRVLAAASLAAHYSKARDERAADVIVAHIRDVHRAPGGAPGQVTVRRERTVRVPPQSPSEVEGNRAQGKR